jgi:hypothetical protein
MNLVRGFDVYRFSFSDPQAENLYYAKAKHHLQSLRFDLVRGSVLSSFPIIPSRIMVLSSPYTCSFSAPLIQQREAIGGEEDRHCVERE